MAAAVLLTVPAAPALAADFVVTVEHDAGNGVCTDVPNDCTLRDAVTQAGASDRVILPGGTYELEDGDLPLNGDTIVGTGARSAVIVGDGLDRVILADTGVNHVSGVTITGGENPEFPSAGNGAGALVRPGATLEVVDSTVSENEANEGGGLVNVGGTLTVERSTIADNRARNATSGAQGGGLALFGGTTTIRNSTISGNSASNAESPFAQGAAIYVVGPGTLDIRHSTIADNASPVGSAIAGHPTAQSDVTVSHTIIDGIGMFSCSNVAIQGSRNIVDDSSCGSPVVDPLLGPLQNNGGPTDTHALAAGSPAVDAGSGCDAIDQRGLTRIRACDVGSFELGGARVVSLTADGDDGECTPLHCTLREAISRDTAAEIHLTDDEYGLASPLVVDRSVTIRGVEDELATLAADPETTERAMIVAPGAAVQLFRLQISGGNEVAGDGGGLYVPASASAVVTDSLITGNFARHGGGIWAEGPLTLVRTTVAGNEAIGDGPTELGHGGGIALGDGAATATFTNTTISGNLATGLGGGIYTQRSMSLRNVSIVENEAPARGPENIGKGGGLYQAFQASDQTTAANTLLARNENGACGGTEFFQIAATNSLLDEPLPNTTCNAPQIPSNQLVDDALIGPLEYNGGLTPTHALADESPAINKGANCPGDDQRGFPRPVNVTCDVGAVEFGAENVMPDVSVFTDELTQPGCTVDHCTLRERVDEGEEEITLGAGTYELTAGEPLDLDNGFTIEGLGAGATTIDANGTSRVGHVGNDAEVTITGITVTGGDADAGDNDSPGQGGAFRVDPAGFLRLVRTTLTGNRASLTGGAVSNTGTFDFVESTAVGNRVEGGSPALGGAIYSIGEGGALIENSTVSGNSASSSGGARGAGVYLGDGSELTHVTVSGNTAPDGAGLYVVNGLAEVYGTLVAANQGTECGGDDLADEDHNLADDATCAFGHASDRIVSDARLAPLGTYGGPTRTHALYAGSPALDGGDSGRCPSSDQRLAARAAGPCDIGAFEGSIDAPGGQPPQGGGGGGTQPPPPPPSDEEDELPAPVAGKSVNVEPSGTVKVKLPGSNRFVELAEGEQLPVGTIVDVLKGRVTLTAAGGQTATFYAGIFKIGQGTGARPLTTLTLVEKLSCPKAGKAVAAAKGKKKRRLWGDGSGRFRTKGKHSAATVVGTKWLVEDRCTSTLTRVTKGRVSVRDFVKKKTVTVRAGKKYVARARR